MDERLTIDEQNNTITVPIAYFDNFMERIAEQTAKKTAKKLYDNIYSQDAQRKDFDNRVDNVRLLLKNYRSLKEHAAYKTSELVNLEDEKISAIEILDSFQNIKSLGANELKLESIISSTMRTKALVKYMDDMIALYKQTKYNSGKPEDLCRVDALDALFLHPSQSEAYVGNILIDLASKWNFSPRHIRRYADSAVEQLTALLFGIDGVNMLEDKKRRRALKRAEVKKEQKKSQ